MKFLMLDAFDPRSFHPALDAMAIQFLFFGILGDTTPARLVASRMDLSRAQTEDIAWT